MQPTVNSPAGMPRLPGGAPSHQNSAGFASFAMLFSFPIMSFFLLAAALFRACVRDVAEPDIWWHLRNAQYLLQSHGLPRTDMYSLGAAGSPWINHEWLAELPFYLGFQWAGLRGLVAVYFSLLLLLFAGVYYRTSKAGENCKDAVLLSMAGILLGVVSIGPRMLLFGWLCMVGLLTLLDHFRRCDRGLGLLPPLFALWINLHGSWVYGMVVFGIAIVAGLVGGEWGQVAAVRWSPAQLRKLWLSLGASLAALFVNPFGYKLVLYPFDLLFRQQSNLKNIEEWQSVDFNTANGRLAMTVIFVVLAAAWLSRRQWRLDQVLLTGFALWGALSHVRLLFFAGLVLPPVLAHHIRFFSPYEREKDKPWLNAAIMAGVVAGLIWFYPSEAKLQQKISHKYPAAALSYMEQNHLTGRLFNSYGWGGYLEWYAPRLKPFIDGRADIFVYNGSFDEYLQVGRVQRPLEVLDKYQFDYVLYEPQTPLAYLLEHDPGWRTKYQDQTAVLFERVPMAATAPPAAGAPN
jgi:hypothetical protein